MVSPTRPGPLGIDVLADAARVLQQHECTASIEETFPLQDEVSVFKAALLICIPKKVVHQSPDGTGYYLPQQLRPLSIVNTHNRLAASAARL